MTSYHTPIMVREVMEGLNSEGGLRFIDATLGGGGHTVEIVRRGGKVLGIDADADAIEYAGKRLREELPDRVEGVDWKLVQGNFRNIETIAAACGFANVAGVV